MSVVNKALEKKGITTKSVEKWKETMPTEEEMLPKDKYTLFDRKEKKYRKGIHSQYMHKTGIQWDETNAKAELPKWTRVSQRVNPPGY